MLVRRVVLGVRAFTTLLSCAVASPPRTRVAGAVLLQLLWASACAHHHMHSQDAGRGAAQGAVHAGGHGGGHAGHHRFENAAEWAKSFDDPARDAWQKPDDVIRALALQGDEVVADVGAGTGYFTVRLARALPRGRVLAIDVEPDMVRYMGERAQREGLRNVETILAPPNDAALTASVDVVLVVDTVHHIAQRPTYFAKVRERLASGGRVVVVDFKMGPIPVGPAEPMRIPPAQLTDEMAAAGLKPLALDEALLPYQYIATYGR